MKPIPLQTEFLDEIEIGKRYVGRVSNVFLPRTAGRKYVRSRREYIRGYFFFVEKDIGFEAIFDTVIIPTQK